MVVNNNNINNVLFNVTSNNYFNMLQYINLITDLNQAQQKFT